MCMYMRIQEHFWSHLKASDHEIYHFHHADEILKSPNLSHVDFLDDPAAIHGSRLIISRSTKTRIQTNWSIQKYYEITILNLYIVSLILLAITLADMISSCACIMLLS